VLKASKTAAQARKVRSFKENARISGRFLFGIRAGQAIMAKIFSGLVIAIQ
jgi:hypothetical protein